MPKIKACTNEACVANQKKKKYKKDDLFCLKCGEELSFICKKCRCILTEDQGALCDECEAKAREKAKKNVKILGKATMITASAAVVLVTAFPKLKKVSSLTKLIKKKSDTH